MRTGNRQIEVERHGSRLVITIDCQDEVFARQLYDEISLAAANDAKLRMEIIAKEPELRAKNSTTVRPDGGPTRCW